jgi:hypothetical protein
MDDTWLQAALSLSAGIALAAATGLRVFLPLLILGLAARSGWLPLVGGFDWIASDAGLVVLTSATIAEIAAYYIPWLDNALDLIAGPLAVMAGIVMVASVTTELPPAVRWTLAIVAGGGAAALVQSLTTVGRLKSTAFTGGLGNPVLATAELGGAFLLSLIAVVVPLVAIVLAFLLIFGLIWASRRLIARSRYA